MTGSPSRIGRRRPAVAPAATAVVVVIGLAPHLLARGDPEAGDLDQTVGVVEETRSDPDQMVHAVRADGLDSVVAASPGEAGVNGDNQDVMGGGGDGDGDGRFTGAGSQLPVAARSVGFTSTVAVGMLFARPGAGAVATVPTAAITPGLVRLLGRVMVTLPPTVPSDCWAASRATLIWRVVEVATIAGWPGYGGPPKVTDSEVTRSAVGSNTAWPRPRDRSLSHPWRSGTSPRRPWSTR